MRKSRSRRWIIALPMLFIAILLVAARMAMPPALRWYVNRTIDQSPLYDGQIGDVDVHLWRGAYSIHDIKLIKTTGNVPVPLFAATRVDLAIQWNALREGKVVGRIVMDRPELNFVDGESDAEDQTGANGPWLEMIDDLFPFRINRAQIRDGSVHFRAFASDPPVDVYLSQVQATVENLTNIHDELAPLVATVEATALAMDQARFEYQMKLDPSTYWPTFKLAVRLLGLDVTKANSLARAYGAFDFQRGWFDLIVELDAQQGRVEGYVKPLFRDLVVFSLKQDIPQANVVEVFLEALIGLAVELLENQPRDQLATLIPLRGDLDSPRVDLFSVVGNVLRNAFIRAYLPRLEGVVESEEIQFGPAVELSAP